jgi:hypothetical protein
MPGWRGGWSESKPHMEQEKEGKSGYKPNRSEVSFTYIQHCKYFWQIATLQQRLTMQSVSDVLQQNCVAKLAVSENHHNVFAISMESTNKYLLRKNRGLYFVGKPRACSLSHPPSLSLSHTHTHTHTHTYSQIYIYMYIISALPLLCTLYFSSYTRSYPKVHEIWMPL